jgi:hypothetical protein
MAGNTTQKVGRQHSSIKWIEGLLTGFGSVLQETHRRFAVHAVAFTGIYETHEVLHG